MLTTLLSQAAGAETLYVADKLVLNVYAAPDQASDKVATVETGDALEVIERAETFVHIRLSNDREGWVGSNYLIAEPPAMLRLRELQKQTPASASPDATIRLNEQITALQKDNLQLSGQVELLKHELAMKTATADAEVSSPPGAAPDGSLAAAKVLTSPAPGPRRDCCRNRTRLIRTALGKVQHFMLKEIDAQ